MESRSGRLTWSRLALVGLFSAVSIALASYYALQATHYLDISVLLPNIGPSRANSESASPNLLFSSAFLEDAEQRKSAIVALQGWTRDARANGKYLRCGTDGGHGNSQV